MIIDTSFLISKEKFNAIAQKVIQFNPGRIMNNFESYMFLHPTLVKLTNNRLVTENTATKYFSPVDLPTGGHVLMLNRFDGAYSPGGNSWVQINPNIYRYFPYLYNFW